MNLELSMAIFDDVYTWITISFVIFVAIAYKLGRRSVTTTLDAYIEEIKTQIDEVEALHAEALEKSKSYEAKHQEAIDEAERIIKRAEDHAKSIARKGKEAIAERMAAREKQLESELALLRDNALREMRAYAAQLIAEESLKTIHRKLKKDGTDDLIQKSIERVSKQRDAA